MNIAATTFNGMSVGLFLGSALAAGLGEWRLTAACVCLAAAMAMACWYWSSHP